jgi:hypothetical protein
VPLLVLALVAIVGVASSGGGPVGGAVVERRPSHAFLDYAFTFGTVATFVVFAVVLYAIRPSERFRRDRSDSRGLPASIIALAIATAACLLILFAWRNTLNDKGSNSERNGPVPAAPRAPTTTSSPEEEHYEPQFKWLPVLLIGGGAAAAAVGFAAYSRRRRRLGEPTGDAELVEELASLAGDALEDLRAEPDPRRAVIAAYARMERALGAYGLPPRHFEAPLEFLERAAPTLRARVPAAASLVFELTHLFERAKFSAHRVDAEMKEEAIATLVSLREELRRPAEAA